MAKPPEPKPVVIIGGGLAGCAAALQLAKLSPQLPIVLIEAKSRLGGRVGSYADPASGLLVDYCQHVGMNCCTELKQLIGWLGQPDQWRTERELFFYGPTQERQRLRAINWLPAPLHLSSWLWNWPGLNLAQRWQIARGAWRLNQVPLSGPAAEALDQVSAQRWLHEHGQSPQVLERFWSTIIVSALGEQLERVSILPVAKVFQDGFLRQRDAWHLLVPQQPLSELFGSQMLAALSAHKIDVRLSTNVERISWHGAQADELTLSDGQSLRPQKLIVAVPWHAVGNVLGSCPDAQVQQILAGAQRLASSPISGVHTWWDRAWLPTPHAAIVGRLCQWIFPHANWLAEPAAACGEHYYQVVISASRSLPKGAVNTVGEMILRDIQEIFPEARSAKLLRLRVVTDPTAVFSVSPGSQTWRPVAGRQTGNLLWAGDWTRTGWPATMEGAIRSGLECARALS